MKKCKTVGCTNQGKQMFQIAPGTTVWLCNTCVEEMKSNGEQ
jgi:hypothetical protein